MTQLAAAVNTTDELWTVDALPTTRYVQVDDETVEVRAAFPSQTFSLTGQATEPKIRVRRAQGGSSAASHAEDAELVAAYGVSSGAPAVVHYSEEDPGAVGAGHIWIHPATGDWGSGTLSMHLRNEEDTGWISPALEPSPADMQAHETGFYAIPGGTIARMKADGAVDPGYSYVQTTFSGEVAVVADSEEGAGAKIALETYGDGRQMGAVLRLAGLHIGSGVAATDPIVTSGSADPSAGAGVAAPEGSMYMRTTAAAGQVWIKTGAADTAWTRLATV